MKWPIRKDSVGMNDTAIKSLARMFQAHKPAVVLTGAGISTESGIPDFRSPGTGLYNSIDPMEYLSVGALRERPQVFWKYFTDVFESATLAEPNGGHVALAKLEEAGYVASVITQNIDGLHQKAGSRTVYEVHGHLRTAHCDGCRKTIPLSDAFAQVREDRLPDCAFCGDSIRPDVVLFGDMMPWAFEESVETARSHDMMLVVGSSLTVAPANTLALEPPVLAIVNRESTPFDERADLTICGPAGETLSALAAELP